MIIFIDHTGSCYMAPQVTLCLSYLQGRTGAPGFPGEVGDRGYIVRNSTKPRFGNSTFPTVTSENGKTLHKCLNLIKEKKHRRSSRLVCRCISSVADCPVGTSTSHHLPPSSFVPSRTIPVPHLDPTLDDSDLRSNHLMQPVAVTPIRTSSQLHL